jgi:RimJ/RimL family protein N-acetyltransferase
MRLRPDILQGRWVRLEPLGPAHDAELHAACDADPAIWDLYPLNMSGPHYAPWRDGLQRRVEQKAAIAYAILSDGHCVGVTSFTLDDPNLRCEIGNTYLHPQVRGGAVNPESKHLMLDHAFSAGMNCVQFRVDALNLRSRAAVAKLGAQQDGILRQDRITWTGRVRDTVMFSILRSEWPTVKTRLEARLDAHQPPPPPVI